MQNFFKYFFSLRLNYSLFFGFFVILVAISIGLNRILREVNCENFYWKGFDPVGLLFGALTFFISIVITLKIQQDAEQQNTQKQLELDSNNTYVIRKTNEIQEKIDTLLMQYQNIEVVSEFAGIMEELNKLYNTTKMAENGKIEYNNETKEVAMQLKIMNHSASFGRLLCSDVNVLAKQTPDFKTVSEDQDKLKKLITDTRTKQKDVYKKMKEAFGAIKSEANKFYITLSASKTVEGVDTQVTKDTPYYKKYLSKLDVENKTCSCDKYDASKNFIQKVDANFSEYLVNEKQKKQIADLSKICEVYDTYGFNIPFQAFVTLPVDTSIQSEKFYRCVFFFINDNTIGKGLDLSAICTSNINFVKNISQVLDAEKQMLKLYKTT